MVTVYVLVKILVSGVVPQHGCLLLMFAWKMVIIRGETKQGEEDSKQLRQGESSSSSSKVMLVEASSFWVYGGVLATRLESTHFVVGAVMIDAFYFTLGMVAVPIVLLICVASVLCQPRRNNPKDLWKLRLHFAKVRRHEERGGELHLFSLF